MREESHLDDMRAAIRGDFERLAERRGGQELMRDAETLPDPEVDPLALVPPVPEEAETEDETDATSTEPEPEPEPEPKRSRLARLLGL
jgi:hypothetical protein